MDSTTAGLVGAGIGAVGTWGAQIITGMFTNRREREARLLKERHDTFREGMETLLQLMNGSFDLLQEDGAILKAVHMRLNLLDTDVASAFVRASGEIMKGADPSAPLADYALASNRALGMTPARFRRLRRSKALARRIHSGFKDEVVTQKSAGSAESPQLPRRDEN